MIPLDSTEISRRCHLFAPVSGPHQSSAISDIRPDNCQPPVGGVFGNFISQINSQEHKDGSERQIELVRFPDSNPEQSLLRDAGLTKP